MGWEGMTAPPLKSTELAGWDVVLGSWALVREATPYSLYPRAGSPTWVSILRDPAEVNRRCHVGWAPSPLL